MDRSLISDADKATGSADKMVAEAALAKSQGNELFSAGKYAEASAAYTRALELCGTVAPATTNGKATSDLRVTLLTNRAAAALKDSKFDECISDCTAALEPYDLALRACRTISHVFLPVQHSSAAAIAHTA